MMSAFMDRAATSYDRARHGHMQEQLGKKFNLTDADQIAERRRIRDGDHLPPGAQLQHLLD
jgi:hypothetical protein